VNALRRHVAALPSLVKAGFVVLGLGLLADAGYHLAHVGRPMPHESTAALVIHGLVAVGMVLALAGVGQAAFGHRTRIEGPDERRWR
jgi:hypothetical protein